jgi:predicted PurR-regulated permease PerM
VVSANFAHPDYKFALSYSNRDDLNNKGMKHMTKSDTKRRVSVGSFLLILLIITVMTITMLKSYLIAMTMGLIMAILMAPLQKKLVDKKIKPGISALIVTLLLTLLIIAPAMTFAGLAAKQGISFGKWVTEHEMVSLETVVNWINARIPTSLSIELNADLQNQVKETISSVGMKASEFILNVAKEIPEALMQVFIILLTCYFILVDGKTLLRWITEKIPVANELRTSLAGSFQSTAISVVWATMAAAGTQAIMMFLAFIVLRIPAAFLAGGCTFIFAFIPVLGSAPIWIAGCIYLYAQAAYAKLIILFVVGILTGLADNIVRPWVLSGRDEMHPFISFIAIFGGLQMFGFFGVFLGPIVAALFISLIQVWPKIIDNTDKTPDKIVL